jgi:hypothetical protein
VFLDKKMLHMPSIRTRHPRVTLEIAQEKEIEYAEKKGKVIRYYSDGEIPFQYLSNCNQMTQRHLVADIIGSLALLTGSVESALFKTLMSDDKKIVR